VTPFDVSLLGAILAGALSFLSPCVLPLVPAYLAFLGGEAGDGRKVVPAALAFVLGFSAVFVALGATATWVSRDLADNKDWLSVTAGLVIVALGLHVMGVLPIRWLYGEKRLHPRTRPAGLIGAFVIGLAFAFGWTPCVGPILATILLLAAGSGSLGQGILLLVAYSAGLGAAFMAAALLVERLAPILAGLRRHLRRIEIATGALLVATGLLVLAGRMNDLAQLLLDSAGVLGRLG